ncbi:DNA/RNA non-specific endonuclease [Marivirga sp. S37H4]|uniref:DNA/RNA non-specific endonuclease n=1 Tax=Marivirga aurantiaca TaxID=2802615 RepID=A0A934WZZ4_9BACT|nr:DNA/RNA non-specific endonuclease [Marivirga aurantiaca]MBK6266001.1 DNA/RNA non-specific endonuclease [Marivirga aurantiaca]
MKNRITVILVAITLLFSCQRQEIQPLLQSQNDLNILGLIEVNQYEVEGSDYENHNHRTTSFIETFEDGAKSSYSAASVNLGSGSWYLSDALIGTLSSDRKYGSKSSRIRNTGYVSMNFNMDNGAASVKVRHAKYGSDGNSSWRLIMSTDNGSSWYYVGTTVNTTSISLYTATFDVNVNSSVRFGIYKVSGGSNRVNIDNIEITSSTSGSSTTASRDNNLTFGNPSDAGTSSSNNYLVNRTDYALSYNNSKGTPNWVSWHLSSAWVGSASRCDCFKSDTSLPSGFFKATSSDYTNSGYDRGHLCPSADRTYSSKANSNTFFMTNIAPQAADNNQRSWATLEGYCRKLASEGNEIFIVAGVAGSGGTGKNGNFTTIDGGNITVPDSFWKVILVLPNGSNDVSRVTSSTRMIAVNIPNDQGINTNWANYRTTVDNVENISGLDLFENINNTVETYLESRVDNGPTN